MEHKIYIQSFEGWPIADWAVSAYQGFLEKDAKIILFEDIEEVPKARNNLVVAYIQDTRKYFKKLGIVINEEFSYPPELEKYYDRKIWKSTLKEFRLDIKVPVFVKPAFTKDFVAGVITKKETVAFNFKDKPNPSYGDKPDPNFVPEDTMMILSDAIDFISEYRCYIIDGELKGIKHYLGDMRVFPDTKVIDAAIADFTTQPAGYAMDFGVTRDGKTLVIECNDAWGLGNYGLADATYAKLLATRWREIMKNN